MISIKDYFQSKLWQFTQPHNKSTYILGFGGNNGSFQAILDIFDNDKSLSCYTIYGQNAQPEKTEDMLYLINLINNDIFFGNFELNTDSGEIRCKTTLSLKHIELTENVLDDIIIPNIITMNRFIPSIKAVLYNDENPISAYQLAKP